jgi:biopolymer transport protein ExbD
LDAPQLSFAPSKLSDEEPLLPAAGPRDEARFDITAMIDLVFMLNIFFLVTTVVAALAEMDLPVVRHAVATEPGSTVVVSLVRRGGEAVLYFGENPEGDGLTDPDEQKRRAREAAQDGRAEDKDVFLIKAEKEVKLRDVQRIAAAAADVPGIQLRLGVIEKDE